jgi:hypothetical protein
VFFSGDGMLKPGLKELWRSAMIQFDSSIYCVTLLAGASEPSTSITSKQ